MGYKYDIADQQCLGIIKAVRSEAETLSSPRTGAETAVTNALNAAESPDYVNGALQAVHDRLSQDVANVQNFYVLAVASATQAVVYYQTGDEQMAANAAAKELQAPGTEAPRSGGPMRPSAV